MHHFHCHHNSHYLPLNSLVSSAVFSGFVSDVAQQFRSKPWVVLDTFDVFLRQTFSILLPYCYWLDLDNVNACRTKAEYLNLESKACVEEEILYKTATENMLRLLFGELFNETGLKRSRRSFTFVFFSYKAAANQSVFMFITTCYCWGKKLVLIRFNLIFECNSNSTNLRILVSFNHRANQNQTTER